MRKSTVKKTVTKAPVNKKETVKAETVAAEPDDSCRFLRSRREGAFGSNGTVQ